MILTATELAARFGLNFGADSKELSVPAKSYSVSLVDTSKLKLSFYKTRRIIIRPTTFGPDRITLPLSDIRSVQRVEDKQWTPSRLEHFLFDLGYATIAGIPVRQNYTLRLPGGQKYILNFLHVVSMERVN